MFAQKESLVVSPGVWLQSFYLGRNRPWAGDDPGEGRGGGGEFGAYQLSLKTLPTMHFATHLCMSAGVIGRKRAKPRSRTFGGGSVVSDS